MLIGLLTGYVLGMRLFVDNTVAQAIERTGKADVCACEDCAGITGAPDAAAGIAGAAWLEAMQAEEAIVANRKGRRARARMRQGQGRAETGQGSHNMPSPSSRGEACASTIKAAARPDGPS